MNSRRAILSILLGITLLVFGNSCKKDDELEPENKKKDTFVRPRAILS
jgi:hypothetical protein